MADGWDEEFDVVAIGSGAAGLVAAIVGARRGVRTLVIEKNEAAGGVTALSGGQIWIAPNRLAAERGISDSVDDATAYMDFLASGFGSTEHRSAYVTRGNEAIEYLSDAGLGLALIDDMPDYYFPMASGSKSTGRYLEVIPFDASVLGDWQHRIVATSGGMTTPHGGSHLSSSDLMETRGDPMGLTQRAAERLARNERCMGAGLAANLINIALQSGVEIWLSSEAKELIGTSGVEGVLVNSPEGSRRVRARLGVVLAMGAYDWNPELIETFEYVQNMYSLTLPTVTGDHFVLAAKFRAAIGTTLPQGNSRHVGLQVPGEVWGGRSLVRMIIPGLPHCILVNRQGQRFGDESFTHSYISALYEFDGATQAFPNWPAWLVFDQNYRDKYPIGPIAPGDPLPEGMAMIASSPGELARAVGIDPIGLDETIEQVDRYAASGVDEQFGRGSIPWSRVSWGDPRMTPNPNLGPLNKPPFYAIPLWRVGTGIASAGLKTSPTGQVLDVEANRIPGLYALGNSSVRSEMGCGYNSGMAIGRSIIFGYLAALDMTGEP